MLIQHVFDHSLPLQSGYVYRSLGILGAQRDLLLDARRLRVPALWVSSENDGYTNFAGETRQLYRGARGHARPDRLLVVGGADHGVDLLTGAQARRVGPAVTRFIRPG